jgi:Zn-finger nucleic acid-binding protein
MKCPRDGILLQRVNAEGVELDKCHKCNGIWFDRGEFEKLRDLGLTDVEEAIEKEFGHPDYQQDTVNGYMHCPRCDGRLSSHIYTYVDPVRVDTCLKCLGVWLDEGELDKIVAQKKGLNGAAAAGMGTLLKFLTS